MCHNACNSQTEDVGLRTLIGGNRNFLNDFTNILMLNFKTEKTANEKSMRFWCFHFPHVKKLILFCMSAVN